MIGTASVKSMEDIGTFFYPEKVSECNFRSKVLKLFSQSCVAVSVEFCAFFRLSAGFRVCFFVCEHRFI